MPKSYADNSREMELMVRRPDDRTAPFAMVAHTRIPNAGEFMAAEDAQLRRSWLEDMKPNCQMDYRKSLFDDQALAGCLNRYFNGRFQHPNMADAYDRSVVAALLVDLYEISGREMRKISSEKERRSMGDCAIYGLVRAVHWAAADEIGRLFPGSADFKCFGDRADQYIQNSQLMPIQAERSRSDQRDAANMVYLNDGDETEALKVHVVKGLLMVKNVASGELVPLHTLNWVRSDDQTYDDNTAHDPRYHGNNGVAGYCMTLDHNIFATKHHLVSPRNGMADRKRRFYHSSYVHGNDVVSAGAIMVDQGKLLMVDNLSGHYRPTPEKFMLVLRSLQAQGVKMDDVQVYLKTPGGDPMQVSAVSILENPEILTGQFDQELPVQKTDALMALLAAYEGRSGKWYARPSAESLAAVAVLKTKTGHAFVESCLFYAYAVKPEGGRGHISSQGLTGKQLARLEVLRYRHSIEPMPEKSTLRDMLKKVLGAKPADAGI